MKEHGADGHQCCFVRVPHQQQEAIIESTATVTRRSRQNRQDTTGRGASSAVAKPPPRWAPGDGRWLLEGGARGVALGLRGQSAGARPPRQSRKRKGWAAFQRSVGWGGPNRTELGAERSSRRVADESTRAQPESTYGTDVRRHEERREKEKGGGRDGRRSEGKGGRKQRARDCQGSYHRMDS
ncbi:hypothetical protein RJ55_02822 [Drechmeria coniospora]|nr:hypothetical protein RJ55_02822 [Drechmeria coniospora]